MSNRTFQNNRPSEATLFHLIPLNEAARSALMEDANQPFISSTDEGTKGLEIGFHVRKNPSNTTIARLGSPGDLTVSQEPGRSWSCAFQYLPETRVVLLEEAYSLTEEPLLKICPRRTQDDIVTPSTNSRVLMYGQPYALSLGLSGPRFRIVWTCNILDRAVTDLDRIAEQHFYHFQRLQGISSDAVLLESQARSNRIVRAIASGNLPPIENMMDGKFKRFIGRGGFGHVYRTVDLLFGIPIAMKECPVADEDTKQGQIDRALFKREIDVLQRIRHPNIIEFLGMSMGDTLRIFMPLRDGSLTVHMRSVRTSQRMVLCQRVTSQILHALQYLHSQSIIHRDLKPENILVQTTGLPHGQHHTLFQLADFGLANSLEQAQTRCGTEIYAAPELLAKATKQTTKIDIYSLFVCMVEVLEPLIQVQWKPPSTHMVKGALSQAKRRMVLQPFENMVEHDPLQRPNAATLVENCSALWERANRAAERHGFTTNIPAMPVGPGFIRRRPMAECSKRPPEVASPQLNSSVIRNQAVPARGVVRQGGNPLVAGTPGNRRRLIVDRNRMVERWGPTPKQDAPVPTADAGRHAPVTYGYSAPRDGTSSARPRGVIQRSRAVRDGHRVTKRGPRAGLRITVDSRHMDSILNLAIPGAWPRSLRRER